MMGVYNCKTKKDLKARVGQRFDPIETSVYGNEYKGQGTYCVVGPDPYRKRSWYANVTVDADGIIVKVS